MSKIDDYFAGLNGGGGQTTQPALSGGSKIDQYFASLPPLSPRATLSPLQPPVQPTKQINVKANNAISNYLDSSANTVTGFGNALLHPINTAKKLGALFFNSPDVKAGIDKASGVGAVYGKNESANRLVDVSNLISGTAQAMFSPITGAFKTANKIPGLKQVADTINVPFTLLGVAGSYGSGKIIDVIPDSIMSPETKNVIKQPLQEVLSLALQVALGGRIMEKIGEYAKRGEVITPEVATKIVEEAKKEARLPVKKVADDHYQSQLDAIRNNKTVTFDPDHLKKLSNDYNPANAKEYSKATLENYKKAVEERSKIPNANKEVILTSGGPGSGKSEYLTKPLKYSGKIVYDAPNLDLNSVRNKIKIAKDAGMNVEIHGILSDPVTSRYYQLRREAKTGRAIPLDYSAKAHSQFPATMLQLLKDGEQVKIRDTRGLTTPDEIKARLFEKDPLAILSKVRYTKEEVKQLQQNVKYNKSNKEIPIQLRSGSTPNPRGEYGPLHVSRGGGADNGKALYDRGRGSSLLPKANEGKSSEIGITSFRGKLLKTIAETKPYFETSRAKGFENSLNNTSESFGVSVDNIQKTAGFWEGGIEPSFSAKVRGSIGDKIAYAVENAKKGNQDAVIIFTKGKGNGVRYSFKDVKNPDVTLKKLHSEGVSGATIAGNEIRVYDSDGTLEAKLKDFSKKINIDPTTTNGKVLLIFKENYGKYTKQPSKRGATDRGGAKEPSGRGVGSGVRPKDGQTGGETLKPVETPPKPIETKGSDQFTSRVFERLKAENPQLEGDITATHVNLKVDAEKAVSLILKDKQDAYEKAMGAKESSDITSTNLNIALAEKAFQEGNHSLYARLIKNRSLAQTRRGQEIVAEKGSITDNSTNRYVKELLATRLETLGKKYLGDLGNLIKKTTDKGKATAIIDREVAKLEGKIKSKKLDTKTALSLLDKLTCI